MFLEALAEDGYLLIKVASLEQHDQRTCAIQAESLLAAIHSELKLPYDEGGRDPAISMAQSNIDLSFSFKNPAAYKDVECRYTEAELTRVRGELRKYTDAALAADLASSNGNVHELYVHSGENGLRDAVAHVALERGINVAVDDRTDQLYPLSSREKGQSNR
jgi:hypothetical protein